MTVTIPSFCLVVFLAPDTPGTARFLRRNFSDDSVVVFGSAGWLDRAARRLARRDLVVVAAQTLARRQIQDLIRLAKHTYAMPVAILLDDSIRRLRAMAGRLTTKGFKTVHSLDAREAETAEIATVPLRVDRRDQHGPFDIVGDVHGCADELEQLLARLGYRIRFDGGDAGCTVTDAPSGRRVIFVGDFVDRGPRSPDVMRIAMALHAEGLAFSVPGNHDVKFLRWLEGRHVTLTHGLDRTVEQFSREGADFREKVRRFVAGLPSHAWLAEGQLVVAHAGIQENMIGRDCGRVSEFCIYGDTDGEKDEAGLVIRYHWAAGYRGEPAIIYGHTPVEVPGWINNTLCIDTGCCFGGALTALRWPEREVVSVSAAKVYSERGRPFGHPPVRPR